MPYTTLFSPHQERIPKQSSQSTNNEPFPPLRQLSLLYVSSPRNNPSAAIRVYLYTIGVPAIDVLREGLEDLRDLYQHIQTTFQVHEYDHVTIV